MFENIVNQVDNVPTGLALRSPRNSPPGLKVVSAASPAVMAVKSGANRVVPPRPVAVELQLIRSTYDSSSVFKCGADLIASRRRLCAARRDRVTQLDLLAILCDGRRVTVLHAESHPDHTVTITVSGEVAFQNPEQIGGAVRAAIVRWAPRAVLVDIADVSLLETATIAALLASHQAGEWAGTPVTVVNVGVFALSQLREKGLVCLLCPHLLLTAESEAGALDTPPSPEVDRPHGSPTNVLALRGGAAGHGGETR